MAIRLSYSKKVNNTEKTNIENHFSADQKMTQAVQLEKEANEFEKEVSQTCTYLFRH